MQQDYKSSDRCLYYKTKQYNTTTKGFSPILYCRPDVVTLGNPFDTMKRFCLYSQCSHLPGKPLDTLPTWGGCSEGLDAFRFFLNTTTVVLCRPFNYTAGLAGHQSFVASSLCKRIIFQIPTGWERSAGSNKLSLFHRYDGAAPVSYEIRSTS